MDRASRETWAKRVERWDSVLTAKGYAAELGIKAHSLTLWKWRLSSGAAAPKGSRRKRRSAKRSAPAAAAPLTFVEMTTAAAPEPLEVVLPSSIRIRIPWCSKSRSRPTAAGSLNASPNRVALGPATTRWPVLLPNVAPEDGRAPKRDSRLETFGRGLHRKRRKEACDPSHGDRARGYGRDRQVDRHW